MNDVSTLWAGRPVDSCLRPCLAARPVRPLLVPLALSVFPLDPRGSASCLFIRRIIWQRNLRLKMTRKGGERERRWWGGVGKEANTTPSCHTRPKRPSSFFLSSRRTVQPGLDVFYSARAIVPLTIVARNILGSGADRRILPTCANLQNYVYKNLQALWNNDYKEP